jgi:AhpD family alkylhydroperoxidase
MKGAHIFAQVAGKQVRFVKPVPMGAAGPLASAVTNRIESEIKLMVPPLLAHTPNPLDLAACWVLVRETLLASGQADRIAKEAVAAAVSLANECPYCLEMHAIGVRGLGAADDADAIGSDELSGVTDPRIREIVLWARTAHLRADGEVRPLPYPAGSAADLIGVVVAFHYLTRMVNIFLPNYLLPPALRGGARRQVKARVAKMMTPMLQKPGTPGATLDLLADAPLPPDAGWAAGSTHVAEAVARAGAAFDRAGEQALSPDVRQLLLDRLDAWTGEDVGPSRAWLEPAVAGLSESDRAAGRLVLLSAFASYQLLPEDVDEFRETRPRDDALVAATAWASYTVARRVGSWQSASLDATSN